MQLSLREGGRRWTLYLAGSVTSAPTDTPYHTRIRGVQVSLWREDEHFCGLAEPIEPPSSTP